ncbi:MULTISPECIES: site-2 protease family protein [unclassified Prochlorococcus]|uniref:site-2 protease family protein n=1 Tax=unclassified Prochlorococcus TaxID=2627481 RepID=UPI0005338AA1|nr:MULTISPECIES: site-2 protease family protein [unclassified Prochlorococcus]KGG16421.1 Metal dependent membrane associated protease [Prochlorococcus sp. MIT 0602]KGG17105.1 Metal dependent membrane associated protease [Prochlorococcus sp. MIT 0603]
MEGIEVIKLKGISLKVHPSWFFILIIFTRLSQIQFSRTFEGQLPIWQGWCIGFLISIALLISVVLRELGHSFMALNEGVKVSGITVVSFGGIKRVDKQCSTAMATLRVAIAGPLVNISLGMLFLIFARVGSSFNPVFVELLIRIGIINILLAVVNLLPGLPLDGGVILKSLVWHFTGSQRKGHKAANASARVFSLIVIFIGGLTFTVKGAGFLALCLIIMGWFGFTASRSQDQIMIVQQALSDLSVSEAARKRFRVLDQDQSLKRLSELGLNSSNSKENNLEEWVLLCSSGRWVGYVTSELLMDVPSEYWDQYLLANYKKPLSELPSINDCSPLWKAVLKLDSINKQRLLVFNAAGLPCGTIDKVDLAQIVLKKLGIELPQNLLEMARKNNIYPLGISLSKIVEGMVSSGLIQRTQSQRVTK